MILKSYEVSSIVIYIFQFFNMLKQRTTSARMSHLPSDTIHNVTVEIIYTIQILLKMVQRVYFPKELLSRQQELNNSITIKSIH